MVNKDVYKGEDGNGRRNWRREGKEREVFDFADGRTWA